MKRPIKIILIFLGVIFLIYEILGFSGIFKVYSNPTTANEPNLEIDSKMFVSNLKNPEIGDFVCYKYQNEMLGDHIRVHRLCGMENDVVEIINGTLFINDVDFDKNIDLVHFYKIGIEDYDQIRGSENIIDESFTGLITEDLYLIRLKDNFASSKGWDSKKLIDSMGKTNEFIKKIYNKNWNNDNFGPLTIPSGKIFILGDNRHNSEDSRTIGLIDKSDIVGVIIK